MFVVAPSQIDTYWKLGGVGLLSGLLFDLNIGEIDRDRERDFKRDLERERDLERDRDLDFDRDLERERDLKTKDKRNIHTVERSWESTSPLSDHIYETLLK